MNQEPNIIDKYSKLFSAIKKSSPVALPEVISEQTIKTAIHEIAHAKLYSLDENVGEGAVESVVYRVCYHYGINAKKIFEGSLDIQRSVAEEIIRQVDEQLRQTKQYFIYYERTPNNYREWFTTADAMYTFIEEMRSRYGDEFKVIETLSVTGIEDIASSP